VGRVEVGTGEGERGMVRKMRKMRMVGDGGFRAGWKVLLHSWKIDRARKGGITNETQEIFQL